MASRTVLLLVIGTGVGIAMTNCSTEGEPTAEKDVSADSADTTSDAQGTDGGMDVVRPDPAPPLWEPVETTGEQRAVAMLVQNDESPEPCTQTELEQFFARAEQWYDTVSYGKLDLTFDPIVAWIDADIPAGQTSNFEPILRKAANEHGVDFRGATQLFAGYTRGAGGGESPGGVDEVTVPDENGSYAIEAARSFVKGFDCSDSDFDTTIHELGHGFGLGHSSFLSSEDGSVTNYGMLNDVMASGGHENHFSAAHRDLLGWLTGEQVGLVERSGVYRLDDIDQLPARVLRIPTRLSDDPDADKAYYYLELRGDAGQSDGGFTERDGVVITKLVPKQFSSETEPDFRMYGVDATPETPSRYSEDFALLPGRTWSSRLGDIHVTLLEKTGDEAFVRIQLDTGDNQPPVIDSLGLSDDSGSELLEVEASDPDGDGPLHAFWSFVDGPETPYTNRSDFAAGTRVLAELDGSPRQLYVAVGDGHGGVTWSPVDLFGHTNRPPRISDVRRERTGLRSWDFEASVRDDGLLWWSWEFGDGTASSVPSPTHTYEQAGRYTVRLEVTDGAETTSTEIEIDATATSNQPPIADAGPDRVTDSGEATVDGSGSRDPDRHPNRLRHFWSGPPEVDIADERHRSTTVRSNSTGTFSLELRVYDGDLDDTDTVDVTFR
jgi:hypothetical protein